MVTYFRRRLWMSLVITIPVLALSAMLHGFLGLKDLRFTGENRQVADWASKAIGLDEYFAEVLPQEKPENIKEVQPMRLIVAMIRDGVNDAPALARQIWGLILVMVQM
jgi:P-type E1-E2 ATPase